MRMIFVNLPVRDLAASRDFFSALGYSFNEEFSDDTAACMVIADNIFAMLLTHEKFEGFINGEIADGHKVTEVLTALSADSRQEVDDILAKALKAGAKPWKPIMDMGFMYGCSFQDLARACLGIHVHGAAGLGYAQAGLKALPAFEIKPWRHPRG